MTIAESARAASLRRTTAIEKLVPPVPVRYPLASRNLDELDLKAAAQWLATNPQITQGRLVRELEDRWSDWLGRRHAAFVSSGSTANEMMFEAGMHAGRMENHKVVVQAAGSWATTISPAIYLSHATDRQPLQPIMCGLDPQNFGLNMEELERICERDHPDAVIFVPTLGVPSNMDALLALKDRFGFFLMEDGCSSAGSTYKGRRTGTFGDIASCSFYFGHQFAAGEGGTVASDDAELHRYVLMARSHGWGKDLEAEDEEQLWAGLARPAVEEPNRIFQFYIRGHNVRNTEIGAYLGLTQFPKAATMVARRTENQRVYERRFAENPAFFVPHNPDGVTCSISFSALAETPEHRLAVWHRLRAEGIETRPIGGGSMGRQPFWTRYFPEFHDPVADAIHTRSFMLPNNPDLTVEDIHHICDVALSVPVPGARH